MEMERFLDELASDTPTPGGGSASALAGALSASLVAMVAGLSFKRGRIQSNNMVEIRRKAMVIQKKLRQAVEEDARSFGRVMEAFRLPKNGEREKAHRSKMIQKAYRSATLTPQKVCELSVRLLDFSEILLKKGNPNAFSDAGVAAHLALAALEGGLLNIRINLMSIRDKVFGKKKATLIRRLSRIKERRMSAIQKEISLRGAH